MGAYILSMNTPAMQQLRRIDLNTFEMCIHLFAVGRLYLQGGKWVAHPAGEWVTKPPGRRKYGRQVRKLTQKLDDVRVLFRREGDFVAAREVFDLWQQIKALKIEHPFYGDKVFRRIATARKESEPLTLFVPWGIRPTYSGDMYETGKFNAGSAESQVLDRVFGFQHMLDARKVPSRVLIMPADLYAINVNGMDTQRLQYFDVLQSSVAEKAATGGGVYEIAPWSRLREQNADRYAELAAEYTDEQIGKVVPWGLMDKAFESARKYSVGGDYRQAAMDYLRERLCEGHIIEELFWLVVKLSCVPPRKNKVVDGPLPILNLIPSKLRAPWLQPPHPTNIP